MGLSKLALISYIQIGQYLWDFGVGTHLHKPISTSQKIKSSVNIKLLQFYIYLEVKNIIPYICFKKAFEPASNF